MIFLDSTVLVDYFNGRSNWQVEALESFLGKELIVTGDYVLTEVLQGFRNDKDFRKAKAILELFPCFDIGGKNIAIKSAMNFRYLLRKGITVRKMIDTVIATFCIENDFTLLHNDKDFLPFEKHLKLKVVKQS